jgi:hypothetical protein
MTLSRFVLTATVTLPADALTPGTDGFGDATGTDAAGHWGTCGATFPKGTVIHADSSAGTAANALYVAIGASNLRAYTDNDAVGHAATGN